MSTPDGYAVIGKDGFFIAAYKDQGMAELVALKQPHADIRPFVFIGAKPTINQCDGCQRGLPTRTNGHGTVIHDEPSGSLMACTADRY
jgi:hypothetical protein